MSIRQIRRMGYQVQTVTVGTAFEKNISAWLVSKAQEHKLTTMLAHADDGVIWGNVKDGQLITSRDAFPEEDVSPLLRPLPLQQLRLFGADGYLQIEHQAFLLQLKLVEKY